MGERERDLWSGAPPDGRTPVIAAAVAQIRRNELSQAGVLLGQALADSPDDPAFLHLLGTVRRLERRGPEAEALFRRSLAVAPAQPHVHRDLGKLLAATGRTDEGIAELTVAIRLKPADAEAHSGLAAALVRQGEHACAEGSYRQTLRLQPDHAMATLGLAETLCRLGRPREAEPLLRTAIARGVADANVAAGLEYQLGNALRQQKKFNEALARFDAAQAKVPDFPAVDFARAETLQQIGRWEDAAGEFRKVLARRPDNVIAAASLALICTLQGNFDEAREWSARALAREPAHPIAMIALAMAEIEKSWFADAELRLLQLFADPAHANDQGLAVASGFAADALDRRGRFREAFAVSSASKNHLRAFLPAPSARVTGVAQEIADCLEKSSPWSAGPDLPVAGDASAAHVFVLGFPRSGTTLVETILATDNRVIHAHEVDFLAGAAQTFLASRAGFDRLAALDADEILKWRENYWIAVRAANYSVGGKIFVDKMPINTLRLPLIARLFPSAKIILVLRDPRDVVLSCFRRHFDPTPYSYEFHQLEDCARFYTASMRLAETCREKLPLQVLELRYEDIVDDFDRSIRTVCEFAGIAWSEAMRDFRDAAGAIDLRSASARQVRLGLYADAAGHWRHYREQLAPVLPILAPWITRFGYAAE